MGLDWDWGMGWGRGRRRGKSWGWRENLVRDDFLGVMLCPVARRARRELGQGGF